MPKEVKPIYFSFLFWPEFSIFIFLSMYIFVVLHIILEIKHGMKENLKMELYVELEAFFLKMVEDI